jgi:hypothetical protein
MDNVKFAVKVQKFKKNRKKNIKELKKIFKQIENYQLALW